MHAPMACIFGLPAATNRLKKPARTGLNRTAVWVGRNRAFRSRALPVFDSRVRFFTRLVGGQPHARRADELLERHPLLRDVPRTPYRLDDRQKGPSVWEVKHVRFPPRSDDGLPGETEHLLVARHVLQDADGKYFRSNAPEGTPTATLLRVALTRHRVERCFQDQKSELGLDH